MNNEERENHINRNNWSMCGLRAAHASGMLNNN